MTVRELNRDQLTELKQRYYAEILDEQGETPSLYELANIDDYVSDREVFDEYDSYSFTNGDFSSEGDPGSEYRLELGDCLGDRMSIAAELRYIADQIENGYYSGLAPYGTNWSIM